MTFVGLDLHKRYITACALDAGGAVLGEVRRMPVSIDCIRDFLRGFSDHVAVGMEATLYWQWLNDQLLEAGYEVRVADARQVKLIWQARSKTDPIDARKLAELLRVNLFPAIWVPDADTRRRRQLLHARGFLGRQRTQVKNRIHGRLTAENLLYPRTDLYGRAGRAWLATVALPPILRSQVDRLLRIHDALSREIELMDDEVKGLRRDHPMIERLHTMPGVGLFGALLLVAEIGTIERFASAQHGSNRRLIVTDLIGWSMRFTAFAMTSGRTTSHASEAKGGGSSSPPRTLANCSTFRRITSPTAFSHAFNG